MDKLEILLDMIEHPERYTEQQISDLLADEEMRKHYDVMVRLRGAYDPPLTLPCREGVVTFEDEGTMQTKNSFENEGTQPSMLSFENESTMQTKHSTPSLTGRVRGGSSISRIAAIFLAAAFIGGLAWAFVPLLRSHHTAEPPQPTEVSAPSLTGRAGGESAILFADVRLDSMLTVVTAHYGKAVFFGNKELKALRIHTKWNPEDSLAAFVENLNELDGLQLTEQRDTIFVQKGGVQ